MSLAVALPDPVAEDVSSLWLVPPQAPSKATTPRRSNLTRRDMIVARGYHLRTTRRLITCPSSGIREAAGGARPYYSREFVTLGDAPDRPGIGTIR